MADKPEGQDNEKRGQVSPLEELTGVALPQIEGEEETTFGDPSRAKHGSGVSVWFVLALLVGVVAAAYIILDGANDAVFAYPVDKAVEMKGELTGKRFRVRGKVHEGSIKAKAGTLDTRFQVVANEKLMTVAYDKPLPDTFKEGIEVIAEGELDSNGVLVAENVIAKCPSKYEGGPPTAEGGEAAMEGDHKKKKGY